MVSAVDARGLADATAAAVGSDEVTDRDFFGSAGGVQACSNPVRFDAEIGELGAEFDLTAEGAQSVVQDGDGDVLWDQPGVGVGRGLATFTGGDHAPRDGHRAEVNPQLRVGAAPAEDFIDDAEVVEDFQGARLNPLGAGTLYRYFANRATLIAHVVDAVLGEIDLDASELRGLRWQQACETTAHAMFDVLRRHPGVASLMVEHIPLGSNAFALRERALALLLDAGFAPPVAVRAWATLARYVLGFAIQINADDGEQVLLAWPDATGPFPASAAVADHVPVPLEHEFAFGLELLLSGLSSYARDE